MDVRSLEYRDRAAAIIRGQPGVRESVTGATLHFDRNRARAYAEIDANAWRAWAESVKNHTLTHLDRYLVQAGNALSANGVHVHWAANAEDCAAVVRAIAERNAVKRVVKGKSMLSEELGVNRLLESLGIEVFETDLGEYVLQLLDEPPSHILGPAIHRSLDDIRTLFHDRFGTPIDAAPEVLAQRARVVLREAFLSADMGLTGANFVVAETGTVALIENEGNIRLSTSVPRVHVALVGIEKLLPGWTDLGPFLQLTSRAATGQPVGTFVSLVQGPADGPEDDRLAGPEEVHVVFVDNGRSRVLADPRVWEALRCVRCGACLNVCPVYRQTGGHAYGWVYSGPIGAVLNPGLLGLEQTHTLPFASSLCGACYDVCPVRIDIPALLLEWRARAVEQGHRPAADSRMMRAFAALATRPTAFRAAGKLFRALPRRLRDALPAMKDWSAVRDGIQPTGSFHRMPRRDRSLPVVPADSRTVVVRSDAAHADAADSPDTSARAHADAREPIVDRSAVSQRNAVLRASAEDEDRHAETGARASTLADGASNEVLRAVAAALDGRTPLAHPGRLEAPGPVNGPTPSHAVTQTESDAGSTTHPEIGIATQITGAQQRLAVIERFVSRFRANGGETVRFRSEAEASEWIGRLREEFESCAVGALVPKYLSASLAEIAAAPAETAALGVSSAVSAAADTGTLILDSRDGRRTQLLPPTHLVWLREGTVHASLDAALEELAGRLPAALGLHSGPSRSADIGRILVTGVHGPGRVIAAIIP